MKIINYKYGYYDKFTCSIHGKILVSLDEWCEIVRYLLRSRLGIYGEDFNRRILKDDMNRRIENKKSFLVNIRVSATEKVVERFKLKGYKRGNYMFEVIK